MSLIALRATCFDLLVRNFRAAHFAGDHHAIGGHQGFGGDADLERVNARLLAFAIEKIDDFVGNPVRDLVGMSLGHGFARKQKIAAGHELSPNSRPGRGRMTGAGDRHRGNR